MAVGRTVRGRLREAACKYSKLQQGQERIHRFHGWHYEGRTAWWGNQRRREQCRVSIYLTLGGDGDNSWLSPYTKQWHQNYVTSSTTAYIIPHNGPEHWTTSLHAEIMCTSTIKAFTYCSHCVCMVHLFVILGSLHRCMQPIPHSCLNSNNRAKVEACANQISSHTHTHTH